MTDTYKVVMLRHGESTWSAENRFCGWYDAELAPSGLEEAKNAGKMIKDNGLVFDVAYTSVLKRAIKTLHLIQDEIDLHWIPVHRHWRLNERMYGALQGLNKSQTAALHGEDQVKCIDTGDLMKECTEPYKVLTNLRLLRYMERTKSRILEACIKQKQHSIWRRSYDIAPPPIDESSPHFPANDPKYRLLDPQLLPRSECLKDTVERVLPFWYDVIVPEIKRGQRVFLTVHGSGIRALMKHLDKIPDDEIIDLHIPTGIPLVYELDKKDLRPVRRYYLASDEVVKAGEEKIANQGKIKQPCGVQQPSNGHAIGIEA